MLHVKLYYTILYHIIPLHVHKLQFLYSKKFKESSIGLHREQLRVTNCQ